MRRRYVLIGMGLVLAIGIAVPVVAATKSGVSKPVKKAIANEVAKQLAKKIGPSGPSGAPGAPGATGPGGAEGPRGPSSSFIKTGSSADLGTSYGSVLQVSGGEVGGGTFAVTARVEGFDQPAGNVSNDGDVDCRLLSEPPVGPDVTLDETTIKIGENPADDPATTDRGTLTLMADTSLGGGILIGNIDLQCKAASAAADVNALHPVMRLIQVGDSTDLSP